MKFIELGGRSIRLDSIVAYGPLETPPGDMAIKRKSQIITNVPAGNGGVVVFPVEMPYEAVKQVIESAVAREARRISTN